VREFRAADARTPIEDLEHVAQWREAFRSFGCCGVTDPLGDLAALGLLEDFA